MSVEDLNLPDDSEQLKAVFIAQAVTLSERDAIIASHTATIEQRDTMIDELHETISKQLEKLAGMEQQLARWLRRQFGPQKERIDPNQLTLFTADELIKLAEELQQGVEDSVSTDDGSESDAGEQVAAETSKPKRKGHGRRPLPEHLPREVVTHELPEDERTSVSVLRCRTLRVQSCHQRATGIRSRVFESCAA